MLAVQASEARQILDVVQDASIDLNEVYLEAIEHRARTEINEAWLSYNNDFPDRANMYGTYSTIWVTQPFIPLDLVLKDYKLCFAVAAKSHEIIALCKAIRDKRWWFQSSSLSKEIFQAEFEEIEKRRLTQYGDV